MDFVMTAQTVQIPCRVQGIRYNARGVPLLGSRIHPGTALWQSDLAKPLKHGPFLTKGALDHEQGSSRFFNRLDRLNFKLDAGFRSNYLLIGDLIKPFLGPDSGSVSKNSQAEPQIVVLRAQGNKVSKKPVWKTGDADSVEPDVAQAVNIIREGVRFFQALADHNVVVQKYAPDFRFDARPFFVVLDYNPAGDGQGFANASHSMSQEGAHIILIGETPPEGSPDHQFFNPVLDEPMIIFHELAHAFVASLMAYAGHALEYIFLTGAFNESVGDCGAFGAKQFIIDNGGKFLGLDHPGRLQTSAEDFILGKPWFKNGQYLRNGLEPGKPGRPPGPPLGRDVQLGNIQEYAKLLENGPAWFLFNEDRGGVHILSSLDNSRRSMEVYTNGGNWINPLQDMVGGLVFAALLGLEQITPPEATLFEMAAAYMTNPNPQRLDQKAAAAQVTGFFKGIKLPDEDAIKKFLASFDKSYTKAREKFLERMLSGRFDPRVRRIPRSQDGNNLPR